MDWWRARARYMHNRFISPIAIMMDRRPAAAQNRMAWPNDQFGQA
jgi:hypothetical protein